METAILKKEDLIKWISKLSSIDDFSIIHQLQLEEITGLIADMLSRGAISWREVSEINRSFSKEFLENTIQGYGLRKPFGYAGDFLMIERIYTCHKSRHEQFRKWDEYFHLQAAPRAVRNRKDYFKSILTEKLRKKQNVELLNLASGPARDLLELYESIGNEFQLTTTCVEMDRRAIDYARELTHDYRKNISFINKNIFKFDTDQKFDVVWSAGLFDYFDDQAFVMILKKLKNWCRKNGEIIIGNFNEDHNPSRLYMEIFGEWFLYHRTERQLIRLARHAGFEKHQIQVGREAEEVNLFLHIKT